MAGCISSIVQCSGKGWRCGVEPIGHSAALVLSAILQVRGNAPTHWILARCNCDARGRADWRIYITLLEANSLGCEMIDVGALDLFVAVAGKVAPAHVVDKNEDDIRVSIRWLRSDQQRTKYGN